MDKEPKVETTEDEISTEIENHANKNHAVESTEVPPVVAKRSSSGLSLLMSLLALAGVGYLFYKDWQNNGQATNTSVSPALIQQLKDSDQVLSTDLQNVQVDINRVKQQTTQITDIEQQLKQLSDQFVGLENSQQNTLQSTKQDGADSQFDNSSNELALARLQQQITNQAQTITELQSTPAVVAGTQSSAPGMLSDTYEQIEKNAAIQVLLTTDVLLSTHRLPQAIAALDNYLKVSGLKSVDKNKLLHLQSELQQIKQPDLEQIDQQLQALKSSVHALQVSTQAAAKDEPKWYERFVSVKKIETESSISSTAQMVA
ncbi:hypothetical protein MNBD_GAMMA02-311, partial [hydrothermal vent metagenome]